MVLRQTEEETNHSPSSGCRIHFLTSLPCWLRLTQSLFLSPCSALPSWLHLTQSVFLSPCSALPCWLRPTKFLLNPAMWVTLYPVLVPLYCAGYALPRFCSTLPCWLRPTHYASPSPCFSLTCACQENGPVFLVHAARRREQHRLLT